MSKKKNIKELSASLNRRQFLQGSFYGLTLNLALPTLTSLLSKEVRAQVTSNPMNLFIMYMPDGTYPHSINPDGTLKWDSSMSRWYPPAGALPSSLPTMLNKLSGMQSDFSIVSGFQTTAGAGCAGHHADAISRFLTGNTFPLNYCGSLISEHDSIDQIIGQKLSGKTDANSILKHVLSAKMRNQGGADSGTGAHYEWGHNLSYLSSKPAYSYTNPSQMFTDVFGVPTNNQASALTQKKLNILDFLLPDIQSKKAKASTEDKIILDKWLTNYEDLQRTLASAVSTSSCTPPAQPNSTWDIGANNADNYNAIVKANMDIMLSAMECGARQVGVLLMQAEAAWSNNFYNKVIAAEDLHSEVGRTTKLSDMSVDHHMSMAHYGADGTDMISYLRLVTLNNYYMRQYRYFIQGMKSRGIFDNSLATFGYGFRDGNHTGGPADMPFLVAGKGGGFKTGQHFRLTTLTPNQISYSLAKLTPLSNFWASVLSKYGITYTHQNVTGNTNQLFG